MTNDDHSAGSERRVHQTARDIFPRACALLAPLMKSNGKTQGISGFAMAHMVQDHFPELSASEAHIVVATIGRLHRENRLWALLEQQTRE